MSRLLDFLFPKVCAACDRKLLPEEESLCLFCRSEMSFTDDHLNNENDTFKMFQGRLSLNYASSFLYYEKFTASQRMIQDLKYHNNEAVSYFLGKWHASTLLSADHWKDLDTIIPVPINKKKRNVRGYNQVYGYAKELADAFSADINTDALKRKNEITSQVLKGKLARTDIISSHYFKGDTDGLEGKHLLLVDDIITTGSTIEACGKILEEVPDIKLSLASMAIATS